MPNIKEFYNNDSAYVGATWTSNVIYCADVSNIVFTLYESQNCNIIIRYISNNNPVSIIDTTTTAHIGGTASSIDIEIKTLFLQIYIDAIGASPSILRSNGIWFVSSQTSIPTTIPTFGKILFYSTAGTLVPAVTTGYTQVSAPVTSLVQDEPTGYFDMPGNCIIRYLGDKTLYCTVYFLFLFMTHPLLDIFLGY